MLYYRILKYCICAEFRLNLVHLQLKRELGSLLSLKAAFWTHQNRARNAAFTELDSRKPEPIRQATKESKREREMSLEPAYATVTWFNRSKNWGFAKDQWGQKIFLHLSDGRDCRIEKDELVFYKPMNFQNEYVLLSPPTKGDVIRYLEAKGSLGKPKAKPWTYDRMVTSAYIDDYYENQDCPVCGHKESEHSGPECMHKDCHCGDPAYEYDELDDTGDCSQEEPGGITDCW